jgi:hypothetical protein
MGMDSPIPALDNREFALVTWILLGLAASLLSRDLRASLARAVKTLLGWKLLLIFGSMTLYLGALVLLLFAARLWTPDLVSETVLWFLFSGLLILFRSVKAGEQTDFFRKTVLSAFAVAAISEFFLSLRPLGLVLELTTGSPLPNGSPDGRRRRKERSGVGPRRSIKSLTADELQLSPRQGQRMWELWDELVYKMLATRADAFPDTAPRPPPCPRDQGGARDSHPRSGPPRSAINRSIGVIPA